MGWIKLDKKLMHNLLYVLTGFLACYGLWHTLRSSEPIISVYSLYGANESYIYPMHQLIPQDYNQLIDLNFTFSTLNLVCNGTSPFLIILVHSSPNNFQKRKTIRETWGKNEANIKILFAIGSVKDKHLKHRIHMENLAHKDLIQGNFLDSYRNMTYKHVMVFKYVIYHCPFAKYILKTDDDVFVNMPTMKIFLSNDLSPYGASKLLFCTVRKNALVMRSYRSKWRVSFTEYPLRNYPDYCPGWNILYSPDVVFNLYKAAQKTDYFWIDDIHITGTLAQKLNIVHSNIEPLVISQKNLKYIVEYNYNISESFLYGRSDSSESEIRSLWKYAISHDTPLSILKHIPKT